MLNSSFSLINSYLVKTTSCWLCLFNILNTLSSLHSYCQYYILCIHILNQLLSSFPALLLLTVCPSALQGKSSLKQSSLTWFTRLFLTWPCLPLHPGYFYFIHTELFWSCTHEASFIRIVFGLSNTPCIISLTSCFQISAYAIHVDDLLKSKTKTRQRDISVWQTVK